MQSIRRTALVIAAITLAHLFTTSAQEPGDLDNAERQRPSLMTVQQRLESMPGFLRAVLPPVLTSLFVNVGVSVEPVVALPPPQVESSIAVNPLSPSILVASSVDYRDLGSNVYVSLNGGRTWVATSFATVHPGWQSGNDPSVAFDEIGTMYTMYGAFLVEGGQLTKNGVYIARSTDNGTTWQSNMQVIEHSDSVTPNTPFEDKYYIQIDRSAASPYRGYLYTPWKRVINSDSSTQIVFARSTDHGTTWRAPVPVSPRKHGTSTDTTFGQSFPIAATGPDGTVYVAWNDGPIRSIGFARSTDGGATFSSPAYPVPGYPTLGTTRSVSSGIYHVLKGTFRAETYPTMACDISDSLHRGWLYLCWAAGTTPDVSFIRSTDRGATWSVPRVIHSVSRGDQWWPWISVDETNGDIAVVYCDSRNDSANVFVDQFMSYSSDGGSTWIDRQVNDFSSNYTRNPFVDQIFMGDYQGNTFHNGRIYPSFVDDRESPNASTIDDDIYTALVDINAPYPVDNFRARPNPDTLTSVNLSWQNPVLMETIFSKPIATYTLRIFRGGQMISELPAGTTTYIDRGREIDSTERYRIVVAANGDTSIPRFANVRVGGAREPDRPAIVAKHDLAPQVVVSVLVPTLRADSATPLGNLGGLRLYRDGILVATMQLQQGDTGTTQLMTDVPPERGYYRYYVTTYDRSQPANESAASDTVIAYAGTLDPFTESFDASAPRFLYGGEWGITTSLALSQPGSLTDSPLGKYRSVRTTTTQLFPVRAHALTELSFAQIVIVDPGRTTTGDTAFVDASFDGGATWNNVASYTWTDDGRWADSSAAVTDWRSERLVIRRPSTSDSTLIVRFRLKTNAIGAADGWYIDDIAFGQESAVRSEEKLALSSAVHPNPFSDATIVTYELPRATHVEARLVDLMGRTVQLLKSTDEYEGVRSVVIDGRTLEAGIYFYEIVTRDGTIRGRVVHQR